MTERSEMSAAAVLDRRMVIAGGLAIMLVPVLPRESIAATALFDRALGDITKGKSIQAGRVQLEMPQLAENGNSVSLKVAVDSPMTEADHVKTIHILSEKNPIATVARFHLGPRAGRAEVETYVRLADTQRVVAVAVMSDGGIWSGEAEVIVTLAACLDAG